MQSGQAALVDGQGAFVRLNNDGTITLGAPSSITITTPQLTQNGNVQVNGTVTATGDVLAKGTSTHTHTHGGVTSGGSSTASPN